MFDQITALGYGIVLFAIVVVVGVVILYQLNGGTACSQFGSSYTWNSSSNLCYETANTSNIGTPTTDSYTNLNYMVTQLGTTGLSGWVPAVIAIAIGLLFLGVFMVGKGQKGRY